MGGIVFWVFNTWNVAFVEDIKCLVHMYPLIYYIVQDIECLVHIYSLIYYIVQDNEWLDYIHNNNYVDTTIPQ